MIGRKGRTRDKECRRKKSMLRQRILGNGRGVEDRFWKYRRSNWKRVGTRMLKR